MVLIKQTAEQEKTINEMREQLEELIQKDCQDANLQKMLNQYTE